LAKEIGEQLFHAAVPHAVIDLDELARLRPAEPTGGFYGDLVARNLSAVWPNYRALGVERLVLARIIENREEVEGYRAAIPGAVLTICRVSAPDDVLVTRLQHREPGTIQTFLTDVAPQLDARIARLGVEDFTVTNGPNQNISVLAHAVLEQLDWPRPEVANLPT
jgi:hypothetical protein